VELNRAATNRIRTLAASLTDEQFQRRVGEHWTVSVVFAHLAFWDERVLVVLDWTEREGKITAPTIDTVVNDIALPQWLVFPPHEATRLALATAEKLDKRLEDYPPELLEQVFEFNKRYVLRALHRNEHLDEAEQALKG
jgi:hypothetical protein